MATNNTNQQNLHEIEGFQDLIELAQYEGDEPPEELIYQVYMLSKQTGIKEWTIYAALDPEQE